MSSTVIGGSVYTLILHSPKEKNSIGVRSGDPASQDMETPLCYSWTKIALLIYRNSDMDENIKFPVKFQSTRSSVIFNILRIEFLFMFV